MTMPIMPICRVCAHFRGMAGRDAHGYGGHGTCDAYPNGIPDAIWESRVDHRQPYTGDGGIHFEPKDAAAAQYAEDVFSGRAQERGGDDNG